MDNVTDPGPSMILGSDFPGAGAHTWRPRPGLIAVGALAAVAALLWAVVTNGPLDRLVAGAVAVVLAAVTVVGRGRRLVAGPRGLLVCGVGSSRIIGWSQVRSLDSATSNRFGLSSTTLEVDLLDDDLLVFGRTDLGADPADVLTVLSSWWSADPTRPARSPG